MNQQSTAHANLTLANELQLKDRRIAELEAENASLLMDYRGMEKDWSYAMGELRELRARNAVAYMQAVAEQEVRRAEGRAGQLRDVLQRISFGRPGARSSEPWSQAEARQALEHDITFGSTLVES